MKRYIVLLMLLSGCASHESVRTDRVFHTVMAFHPKAQTQVVNAQKVIKGSQVELNVVFNAVRPVMAHVYTAKSRAGFELNQVLADSLEERQLPDGTKLVRFQQHMRDFPDGNYVVIELVAWVDGVPAPVACAWVIFVWDHVYLWDHHEALSPDGGGYFSGRGFSELLNGSWVARNPYKERDGALAIVKYRER